MQRNNIEIMSPVGSYESLMAAIQAGANSVYFGIEMLNMRARSSNNFTTHDLAEIVSICNSHGVKTYLTVNTVLYDSDMDTLHKVVDAAKHYGVTAIIASDIAAIQYARQIGVEVHISTQLNVSNTEAVRFFSQYADVVVLARELNLIQVKKIYTAICEQNITGPSGNLVQIEMFVHGALCMSISGKCYLSLHEQNYSANKGACLQTCRKAYTVTEKESGNQLEIDNEYIMSPKDLCTIGFVDELIHAGVRVFKIEGRARSAEYVKTVTQCYSEAVDAVCNNTYTPELVEQWKHKLSQVFNRGFWDGYYLGQKLGEWSTQYGSSATKIKHLLGKCTNYFSNIGVAEFTMQSGELHIGNDVLIIGKTTGVVECTVDEIRYNLQPVSVVKKGDVFSMKVPQLVRRGDVLYLWKDSDK
ncbi:MAG TPA: peptidase U32 family protein [Bacteroidales bacterium]|jgi:putative protease|nr:peptidase U32 family protein [Bacteroidales bacterium]